MTESWLDDICLAGPHLILTLHPSCLTSLRSSILALDFGHLEFSMLLHGFSRQLLRWCEGWFAFRYLFPFRENTALVH